MIVNKPLANSNNVVSLFEHLIEFEHFIIFRIYEM